MVHGLDQLVGRHLDAMNLAKQLEEMGLVHRKVLRVDRLCLLEKCSLEVAEPTVFGEIPSLRVGDTTR